MINEEIELNDGIIEEAIQEENETEDFEEEEGAIGREDVTVLEEIVTEENEEKELQDLDLSNLDYKELQHIENVLKHFEEQHHHEHAQTNLKYNFPSGRSNCAEFMLQAVLKYKSDEKKMEYEKREKGSSMTLLDLSKYSGKLDKEEVALSYIPPLSTPDRSLSVPTIEIPENVYRKLPQPVYKSLSVSAVGHGKQTFGRKLKKFLHKKSHEEHIIKQLEDFHLHISGNGQIHKHPEHCRRYSEQPRSASSTLERARSGASTPDYSFGSTEGMESDFTLTTEEPYRKRSKSGLSNCSSQSQHQLSPLIEQLPDYDSGIESSRLSAQGSFDSSSSPYFKLPHETDGKIRVSVAYYTRRMLGGKDKKKKDKSPSKHLQPIVMTKRKYQNRTLNELYNQKEESGGELRINVISGDLCVVNQKELQEKNTYVKCYLLPDQYHATKMKSDIHKKCKMPRWNQKFHFTGFRPEDLSLNAVEILVCVQSGPLHAVLGGIRLSREKENENSEYKWLCPTSEESKFWEDVFKSPGEPQEAWLPLRSCSSLPRY